VLEGLEAVDWAALGHAYGSAEDVPWLLRQVRSADPKVRQDALDELFFTIAYQALQAALPALLPLLDEDDDWLRREAVHLLAWFPSFAPASLPRLRGRVHHEPIRDTQATMIVAIGLLAGATGQRSDTPWLSELLAGPDPVLRWAAATALARLAPEHPPDPAVQELLGWLTDRPDANPLTLDANPNAFPSHDDFPFGQYTLKTLVRPGPAARARVAEALLAKLHDAAGWQAERLLWHLMVAATMRTKADWNASNVACWAAGSAASAPSPAAATSTVETAAIPTAPPISRIVSTRPDASPRGTSGDARERADLHRGPPSLPRSP
jgi:hypothetical protein